MNLATLLPLEAVFPRLPSASKKQALKELSLRAEHTTGLDDGKIFSVLMEREQASVTAVGDGIAMPRGLLPELTKTYAFAATLERPVEFGAADGRPIDIIFLLLSPNSGHTDYLKAMATASRLLREEPVCRAIRAATTPEELHDVLIHASKSGRK